MRQSMVDGRYQICRGNHRHAIRKRRLVDSALSCGGSRNASVGLVGVAKQDAERGNEGRQRILSHQGGFGRRRMEEKIEAWSTSSRKRAPPLFTKENVELLESADKRKPAREKPGTSNTPATKKCSKSSRPGRLRGRAVVVQGMQS